MTNINMFCKNTYLPVLCYKDITLIILINTGGFLTLLISPSNILTNFNSCAHAENTTYYASVLLRVTVVWVFDKHVRSVLTSKATKPLTLCIFSFSVT